MKINKLTIITLIVFSLMSTLAVFTYRNNDYMRYQDVPVEYIQRYVTQSCHKQHCTDQYAGLFKRMSDGYVFSRNLSPNMYHNYPVGSRYDMNIRPFDIRQTTRENVIWFFGSLTVYILAFLTGCLLAERLYYSFPKEQHKKS